MVLAGAPAGLRRADSRAWVWDDHGWIAGGGEVKPLYDEVEDLCSIPTLMSDTVPERLRRIADAIERKELFWSSIDTRIAGEFEVAITFKKAATLRRPG